MGLSPERELISKMSSCFDENIGSFITANSQGYGIMLFSQLSTTGAKATWLRVASVLCNSEHCDFDHVTAKEAYIINPSVHSPAICGRFYTTLEVQPPL
jgi:hypothetical protein